MNAHRKEYRRGHARVYVGLLCMCNSMVSFYVHGSSSIDIRFFFFLHFQPVNRLRYQAGSGAHITALACSADGNVLALALNGDSAVNVNTHTRGNTHTAQAHNYTAHSHTEHVFSL